MDMTFKNFINWLNAPLIHFGQIPVTLGGISSAILIVAVSFFISALVQRALTARLTKKLKLSKGMSYALQRILHYVIVFLGVILAAQCVGLNLGSLAVIFGFISVGIGFGLQNVTSNFISGLILLIERPIGAGDLVNVNDKIAEVLNINMRSTTVRTFDNVTIIVPNTKFIENEVINWTVDDPRIRIHCSVGVAYGSDVEMVKNVLLKVAKENSKVLDKPEPEVRFLEFGESSLNFDLLVWTGEPGNQKILRSDINFTIDKAFAENGIRIPFPQRDLHLRLTPAVAKLAGEKVI